MTNLITRFAVSKKASLWMLSIYAVLMALATMVEKFYGTLLAKTLIYYSPLFFLLHLLMVINFIGITFKYKLYRAKHWFYLTIHTSLIIILLGATVTHFFSKEGMLHLREGEKTNRILMGGRVGESMVEMPFEVELIDFTLRRYPGSQSPSSYESMLKLYVDGEIKTQKVFMNNVLDLKGFRFFQASYDKDEMGTILSVSYDTTGRRITYLGYFILFVGLTTIFFNSHSRFRRLLRQLRKGTFVFLAVSLFSFSLQAKDNSDKATLFTHTRKLGQLPTQSRSGRIVPLHTLASEVLRKVYGGNRYNEFTAEHFFLSAIAHPERWVGEPIIEVDNKVLPPQYNWNKSYISYHDAFDEKGHYRLEQAVAMIYRKNPAQRSFSDKELLKLDEKVNILHMLFRFQIYRIFPLPGDTVNHQWFAPGEDLTSFGETNGKLVVDLFKTYQKELQKALITNQWDRADEALKDIHSFQQKHNTELVLSDRKMRAEVKYNKMNLTKVCQIGYLIIGGVLLLLSFYEVRKSRTYLYYVKKGLVALIIIFAIIHTCNLGLRWYLSGYAPWSNSYETMVALAWASVLGGLLLGRRELSALALATLFGGIALFVSTLSWMDPQISPLVPVLKSPWLTFHVAVLIASYGLLGISAMIGLTNLILYPFTVNKSKPLLSSRIKRLTIINEMALIAGLIFLMIGIFLGAIWANESWGRYWSWDPKETWALITAIVYTLVLHYKWFKHKKDNWAFNLFSQLAFLAVLMTFLGVNYLLSGMHSYGATLSGVSKIAIALLMIVFILPGLASYFLYKKRV